jgi:V/A-type H+-transporting ATPase subunit E
LAAGSAKTGEEQIILSPKDKERCGAVVVGEANKLRPNGKFTLAEGSRAINGGLLLSSGDVEINCAFESLIQQLRGELTPQVAQILFVAE